MKHSYCNVIYIRSNSSFFALILINAVMIFWRGKHDYFKVVRNQCRILWKRTSTVLNLNFFLKLFFLHTMNNHQMIWKINSTHYFSLQSLYKVFFSREALLNCLNSCTVQNFKDFILLSICDKKKFCNSDYKL